MNKKKGFTLIELMITIAIIAIIAAIAVPGLLAAQRAANERNASASLKTVATAEADFRANDRDRNRLNDFWVADLRALYSGAASTYSSTGNLKLIEIGIAEADMAPAAGSQAIPGAPAGGAPKSGYRYRMAVTDENGVAYAGNGSTTGVDASHNYGKFGLSCWPISYGSTGKQMFIMNETSSVFKRDPGSPAGATAVLTYPNDTTLSASWSKMD